MGELLDRLQRLSSSSVAPIPPLVEEEEDETEALPTPSSSSFLGRLTRLSSPEDPAEPVRRPAEPASPPGAPPPKEEESIGPWGRLVEWQKSWAPSFGAAWLRNQATLTELPGSVLGLGEAAERLMLPKALEPIAAQKYQDARGVLGALTPEVLKKASALGTIGADVAEMRKRRLGQEAGVPRPIQALQNVGEEVSAAVLDPLEVLPGGALAAGARRGASAVRRVPQSVEPLAGPMARRVRSLSQPAEPGVPTSAGAPPPTPGAAAPGPFSPEDEVLERFDRDFFSREEPSVSVADRLTALGRRFRDEMEDELQPILRSVREADDPASVREMEELLQQVRAAPTRSELPVLRHTRGIDPETGEDVVTGGSLMDVLQGHDPAVLRDAERYMAAQRNRELARRASEGASIRVDEDSLARSEEALAALQVKYGDRTAELDEIASGYRDWAKRAQIDPLIRVGVYDEATAQRIVDENTMYSIFDRVDRDLRRLGLDLSDEERLLYPGQKRTAAGGGPQAGSPVKRIHGGLSEEGKLQGIFESSALQAMRVQKFADRQAVKNMLGKLADEVPEVPIHRLSKKATPVAQVTDEAGDAETVWRMKERGGDTFVRYENGSRVEYSAPPDVLDALGRLTPRQASAVMYPARIAAQMLRAGAVEIPSFAVFNVIRDSMLAPVYSRHGMFPLYDVARVGLGEAAGRLRGKGRSEAWQVAEEFGGFSTMMDVDRLSMRRSIDRARQLTESGGGIRQFLSEWRRNPLLPFHVVGASLERLNRATEASLALAGGRKKIGGFPIPGTLGQGHAKATRSSAGLDAADITLNFMRGGRVGKPWNRYEAFSNAMIQDVSKFAREMKQRPFETSVKAMAFVGVPSLVNYALNKDDPEYQRLPEWERALFYHPGKLPNGWWIRVPRPLGLVSTFFGYGSHKAVEAMEEQDPEAVKEFLRALVETTPLEFVAKPLNLAPNLIQPAIEASHAVNYSQFLDRPIVPRGQESWPAAEQYSEHTSPTMKDIGGALGLSPKKVQYVFEAHTGTLGRESLATLDRLRAMGEEAPAGYLPDAKDIPLAGRFLSRPAEGFSTETTERFYELTEKAMGARSVVRSKQATAEQYPEARLGLIAGRARRQVSDLSDRMARVRKLKISDEAKRQRLRTLERQVTTVAERYNSKHKELER